MAPRPRRNPRNFLILAFIGAFGAGIFGAMLLEPRDPETSAPKTQTRVELPYQGPAQTPAQPQAEAPEKPDAEVSPPTLPPRALDPIEMQRKQAPQKPRGLARKNITILQIGDSHTAADFLTGELRRLLQARYGDGGAGYMSAGRPHIGVRSSAFRINASQGWTYEALQQSSDIAKFWLSGFNATANTEGERITFSSELPVNFDRIEIQALRLPGGGKIEIRLDGVLQSEVNLAGTAREPVVILMVPEKAGTDRVRSISITTKGEGAVNLSSVAVHNRQFGLSYNSVGFPGATIDIVNKFDDVILENELKRLDPQIVVLAFGTNEGFNDGLDAERYGQSFERALFKIRRALPNAIVVLLAPPDAARGPKKPENSENKNGKDAKDKNGKDAKADLKKSQVTKASPDLGPCGGWKTPPMLNRVREIQEQIAKKRRLVYWNWASIMPQECGADRWANQTPPLIAKDRVHFTLEGYRFSAAQFLKALLPVIEQVRQSENVVSNH
jgi:lysophospholipase L1-like esterase